MSLLDKCKAELERQEMLRGFPSSTVKLCYEHNTALVKEVYGQFFHLPMVVHGTHLHKLFGRPVIEESRDGKTLCILCDREDYGS
jgi:hypothetical protein